MEYVIIGNSAAAVGAVEGIRSTDKKGGITIVSSEKHHTYSRPLISYLLQGKTDRERMTVSKPLNRTTLMTAMKLAYATRARLLLMDKKNKSLSAKMSEIRVVNRAKWTLIESLGMTEEQAHHYIEKQSMDMTYKSDTVTSRTGIDVSEYQGNIDWAKVKASGIEFAIIRVGYRGYSTGKIVQDAGFAANIKGAEAAGLKVGVYFFSQAITADEASEEADYVLSCIKGCSLEYPVVFDWEPMGVSTARTDGLSTSVLDGCAGTFCGRITAAGYKPMPRTSARSRSLSNLIKRLQSMQGFGVLFRR